MNSQQMVRQEVTQLVQNYHGLREVLKKIGAKSPGSLIERIMQADPSRDKNFAVSIAKWILQEEIENEKEHVGDIEEYWRLKREFRKTWGPERDSLESPLYKKIKDLFKKGTDFEHYWDLSATNQKIRDLLLLDEEKNQVNWDLLEDILVATHEGFHLYRVPKKGEVKGFDPKKFGKKPNDPFHSSRTSWCVVGSHYGGYNGGPYYCIRKGKQWYACIIPGYLHDPTQALRNPKNDGMLGKTQIDALEWVLPLVPKKEICMKRG